MSWACALMCVGSVVFVLWQCVLCPSSQTFCALPMCCRYVCSRGLPAPLIFIACACFISHVLSMCCRKHLKRDSPSGGPPQDTEDLFRLLKQAANKFNAPVTTAPGRKSRRPGMNCCILFIFFYPVCTMMVNAACFKGIGLRAEGLFQQASYIPFTVVPFAKSFA